MLSGAGCDACGSGFGTGGVRSVGWDFNRRGAKLEETCDTAAPSVDAALNLQGTLHTVSDAGINPLPAAAAHPGLLAGMLGCTAAPAPWLTAGCQLQDCRRCQNRHLDGLADYTSEAGRDPKEIGIEARLLTAAASRMRVFSAAGCRIRRPRMPHELMASGSAAPMTTLLRCGAFRGNSAGIIEWRPGAVMNT